MSRPREHSAWRWIDRVAPWISIVFMVVVVVVLVRQIDQEAKDRRHSQHREAALIAQNRAVQLAAIEANRRARFEDCTGQDRVRHALRAEAEINHRQTPLFYKLLPQFNTPQVRKLVAARYAEQLHDFAPHNCAAYAQEAEPQKQAKR